MLLISSVEKESREQNIHNKYESNLYKHNQPILSVNSGYRGSRGRGGIAQSSFPSTTVVFVKEIDLCVIPKVYTDTPVLNIICDVAQMRSYSDIRDELTSRNYPGVRKDYLGKHVTRRTCGVQSDRSKNCYSLREKR